MKWKDQRMNTSKEVISEIRMIKAYVWEKFFKRKIMSARNQELKSYKSLFLLKSVISLLFINMSVFAVGSIFFMYTLILGHTLDSEKAFVVLATIGLISDPVTEMPNLIS